MKEINIPSHNMNLALLNKYMEVIIQCLETKILNENVDV